MRSTRLARACLWSLLAFAGLALTACDSLSEGASASTTELTVDRYVYSDALATGWSSWTWGVTADPGNAAPVRAGQRSVEVTPRHSWSGWGASHGSGIDVSSYTWLGLSIRATAGNQLYALYLLDERGMALSSQPHLITPPAGAWEDAWIPLSTLGATSERVFGIRLMSIRTSTAPFYVDEIGFAATAAPSALRPTSDALLAVDANMPVHPFSNEMLGVGLVNWEHSWNKPFAGGVPYLASVLEASDTGLIRYAGGLWANWVGWERAPQRTPQEEWNPSRANFAPAFAGQINTDLDYAYHYGIDEIDDLASFARRTGAEVMIQVNVSLNDPYMWADLLHYANVERGYGFKYWELGNELDLEYSQDSPAALDADTYRSRVERYAEVLRSVDPSIVIVGGVASSGHDIVGANWAEGTSAMSRYLPAAVEGGADSLSYHWYQSCWASDEPGGMTVWAWDLKPGDDKISDPNENWRHTFSRIWSQIGPERVQNEVIPSGSSLTQGITELNFDACNHGASPHNSNHLNAVWMADILGRLAYHGTDYVTWYQGYGNDWQGYPAIASPDDGGSIFLRPSYYTLFLYANYFGDSLVASSSADDEAISIWAATDSADPNVLTLMVTNISDRPITTTIDVAGFRATSGSKVTLANPDPDDLSEDSYGPTHGSTLNGVSLNPATIGAATAAIEGVPVSVANGDVTTTFAPYTVTAIRLTR